MAPYWYVDTLEDYEIDPPTVPGVFTPMQPIPMHPLTPMPRWPLGKPYIREPGFPGGTFNGITFEAIPPIMCTDLVYESPPPVFNPGDPIPPNMPPAWGGPPNGAASSPGGTLPGPNGEYPYGRPPYKWEKWMPNPNWNPQCGGMPSVVENPPVGQGGTYDPTAPKPVNSRIIPRPGPAKLKPPSVIVPPGSVEVPVPAVRPPGMGVLPLAGAATRVVMGVGPIIALVIDLLDPDRHAYVQQRACMKLTLMSWGMTEADADTTLDGLETYRNVPSELQPRIDAMISWLRDNGPELGLMVWPETLNCANFCANLYKAVKLARCKLNPGWLSAATLQDRKDSLLSFLEDGFTQELVINDEIALRETLLTTKKNSFCDVNGGHYSQWCCTQYTTWLNNLLDFKANRQTYINDMVELHRCLQLLDMPTCENGLDPLAVSAYIEAVNKEVSAVGLIQLNKAAEWQGWKYIFDHPGSECQ
jgi:hypothetical protein